MLAGGLASWAGAAQAASPYAVIPPDEVLQATPAYRYANMTSERAFAPAKSHDQALAELEHLSGLRYDGMLVRLLIRQLKAEKAPSSL